jgi:hypothetical protein
MTQVRIWYRDDPGIKLTVTLIHTWHRGDYDIQQGFDNNAGGPRDTLHNRAVTVFQGDHTVDAVSYVIARGPMFFIYRRGRQHFDVTGREVEAERLPSAGRTERKSAA